uniref:Uncharacterized protein n=1 Tax=Mycena chlorophos TaxID=658473 RepID=A0ABQ0LT62_MYCCL|nr:predicted protein [Mycena chlorophos]
MRHIKLLERVKDGLSKANLEAEKERNEVLQGRLKTLEAQLTLAKEQMAEDKLELHLERSGKKEVEAELKMTGSRRGRKPSKDALLGRKRPAHDSDSDSEVEDDVPGPSTPKKMKTGADGQQKSHGWKRGTRSSSRSKPHPTG